LALYFMDILEFSMNVIKFYFKISRPMFWALAPLAFISGVIFNGCENPWDYFNPIIVLQMLSLSFPFAFFTFGINDMFDCEHDFLNPRKNNSKHFFILLEGARTTEDDHGRIKIGIAISAVLILTASCLTANLFNLFFTMSLLLLAFTYSCPPWRFKSRPPLDSVTAGLAATFIPFAMGFSHTGNPVNIPFQIYIFSISAMGAHAYSTIIDYTADKACGQNTFAIRFGKKAASLFLIISLIVSFGFTQTLFLKGVIVFVSGILFLNYFYLNEKNARKILIYLLFFFNHIIVVIWIISRVWQLRGLFALNAG